MRPRTAQTAPPTALLIYPLADRDGKQHGRAGGCLAGGRELTLSEADFLEGLALQAAVALENARNHKRNVEFARLQQDLDAARVDPALAVAADAARIPGYSVAFRSDTCYEVGGDYLDIVEQPDGSLLMAVADVAGKGLASAIMSTSFRAAFRGMAATGMPLDELATRMNQHHWAEGEEARRRYVTAIFLRLHPAAGEIEVVNAGHNPGFLLQPGAEPRQFDAAGTPLGLLPGMRYASERRSFAPGARLLFYTDGLTEVFKGDEEFGPERLLNEFSTCPCAEGRWYSRCIVGGHRGVCRGRPASRRHDRTGAVPGDGFDGDAGMSESKSTTVEVRLPTTDGLREGGHEHGGGGGQADGLPRGPHRGSEDRRGRGLHQRHRARQPAQ